MDLHDALIRRRTVHRFAPGSVPDEVVDRALRAATFAPNHKLTWPWRFVFVGPETREELVALNTELKASGRTLTDEQRAGIRRKMTSPDRLLSVAQVRVDDAFRSREDYATIAMAIQNLSLSLFADGVYAKWSTGGVTRHPETYRLLGIDPEEQELVGFVWIGYAEAVPGPADRPEAAEVTRSVP
ncbi:MAG: nitroreductase [Myxococcota bacterium]